MATVSIVRHESATQIRGFLAIVHQVLEDQGPLSIRYLRHKPGRGLTVVYNAGRPVERRWITLTLDEGAPAGRVEVFPEDQALPWLAASCAPAPAGPVFAALQTAARIQLSDARWQLTSVEAEPVRYKPSSRCVIRYRLWLEHTTAEGPWRREVTVFGKIYSDPQRAHTIHTAMRQLYAAQAESGTPFIPHPLAVVPALGLMLAEDVAANGAGAAARCAGLRVLKPGPDGIPAAELRLAAIALARLHTSGVRPPGAPRTGIAEAKRVRERAALIATRNPAQAEAVTRLANELAGRLEALQPEAYLPAHGGFKPSQLLFHSQKVFVVDLDGFCLADPALDLGYFLAYLRPSGLWYRRKGARRWFEASAASFGNAYRQALRELGIDGAPADGILERARVYEAALLFKIATRRVHRLNSPRPREFSAMLAEIADLTS